MTRYSVSSMFFHEYSCSEIFSFADQAGCTALEFWPETPDFWLNGKDESVVLGLLEKHPRLKPLTVHAPVLDLNPCSVNPDVAEVSIENTIEAIELAERLGAEVVTIHPGRRTAKRPAGARDMERFGRYIDAVEEASGGAKVKVALENMPQKINSIFTKPEEISDVLKRKEWLFFTLDIAHATIGSEGNEKAIEFIESAFDRLVNVHVSKNTGERSHYAVADDQGTAGILETLAGSGYRGVLTLELEDLNLGRRASAEEKISIVDRDLRFIKGFFG